MKLNLRNTTAYFYAQFLRISGIVKKAKEKAQSGECILSIYFHNPSKKEFEFTLNWLTDNGFHFISIDDLRKIHKEEKAFPRGAALLTVDDGWASNEANMVELANKYEVPIAIFVTTEPVEEGNFWFSYSKKAQFLKLGYPSTEALKRLPNDERLSIVKRIKEKLPLAREAMTVEQVKRISLSPYVTIGAHSHTHPILNQCTDSQLKSELRICAQKLENWVGKEVISFAYPNGNFGEREKKMLNDFDYMIGFANNPQYITRENLEDMYAVPRIGFLEGASQAENICRIMGVWHSNSRKIFKKNN